MNRGWESSEKTVIGGLREGAPWPHAVWWHTRQPLTYSEVQGTMCTEDLTGLKEEAVRKMLKMPKLLCSCLGRRTGGDGLRKELFQTRAETTENVPAWKFTK